MFDSKTNVLVHEYHEPTKCVQEGLVVSKAVASNLSMLFVMIIRGYSRGICIEARWHTLVVHF